MPLIHILAFTVALGGAQDNSAAHRVDCREWHDCRQQALDARARGEYEHFHDLAWRTVQTGPRNDPALMYLLARAQSLSGRPHDALVMLDRLAEMGVATDAATNDEFKAVRALREWSELDAKLRALTKPTSVAATTAAEPSAPAAPVSPPPAAVERATPEPSRAEAEPAAQPTPIPPAPPRSGRHVEDALRLPDPAFKPRGLAYDSVSGRFLVADLSARKLIVLDERSRHAIDLVRASSAGFSDIGAFEIDPRRGDLWVASTDAPASGDGSRATAALHKLQLVSGRPLVAFALPERFGPARFQDVAVTAAGTVFTLDTEGRRIFSFKPESRSFALVATLTDDGVTSLAPSDDRTIYVAHASGITRIDATNGTATPLHAPPNVELGGLGRIRWSQGALVGLQQDANGFRAVTIRVSNGRAVSSEPVETNVAITDATAVAIAGDDLYVLARANGEIVVQRIRLR